MDQAEKLQQAIHLLSSITSGSSSSSDQTRRSSEQEGEEAQTALFRGSRLQGLPGVSTSKSYLS